MLNIVTMRKTILLNVRFLSDDEHECVSKFSAISLYRMVVSHSLLC